MTTTVPVRLAVLVAGVTIWLGIMLMETGARGLVVLWQVILFLAAIAILSSPTRTVTLQRLGTCLLAGGGLMGVMLLFSRVFEIFVPNQLAPIRDFVIPPAEEILKLVPVGVVLWRGRKTDAWTLGATDVLLIVLVTAAGFGLVENAYLAAHSHRRHHAGMIPFTDVVRTHLMAGHIVWSAIAGVALGLATAIRGRAALIIGAAGIGLGILDHIANNYFAVHPGHLARVLRSLVFDGWLIFYLGMAGALAVLLLDLYVTHSTLPVLPELERPSAMKGSSVWSFLTRKRGLAYAVFRSRREMGLRRAEALCAAALLDAWFLNVRWLYDQPSNVPS
jgi:RsiW-degrading membrane proteinase PrsW (M82 family)